jgi:hypothetical protein
MKFAGAEASPDFFNTIGALQSRSHRKLAPPLPTTAGLHHSSAPGAWYQVHRAAKLGQGLSEAEPRIVFRPPAILHDDPRYAAELVVRATLYHPAADALGSEFPDLPAGFQPLLVQCADDVLPELKGAEARLKFGVQPVAMALPSRQSKCLQVP